MATQLKCHLQTCHLDEDNNTLLSSDVELWILLISLYISLELSATCKLTGCVTEVSDYSQRKYLLRKKKKKNLCCTRARVVGILPGKVTDVTYVYLLHL